MESDHGGRTGGAGGGRPEAVDGPAGQAPGGGLGPHPRTEDSGISVPPAGPGRQGADGPERDGVRSDGSVRTDGTGPRTGTEPEADTAPGARPEPEQMRPEGIAGLSLPYRVVAAAALALVGLFTVGHLAVVFLHVAPSNTVTKQHGEAIEDWVYPEFEQNWKLFAPNPLQQNISVHVRAEVAGADGRRTTRWMSLSAEDGDVIRGSLLPSHTRQNELRRAWDFFVNYHGDENKAKTVRGRLSEQYVRRIAMLRLGERDYGGTIERIQVRSMSRTVAAPSWSTEKSDTAPQYQEYPWWTVTPEDLPRDGGTAGPGLGEEADK
ncbi:DUF5819 family protein [uncultured Streptomyces sp.]|uniref:DUF5819 family protein n=1 Tax=uncultured Streptomyces sp. TaxID=174707 RepID=UPI002630DADA|nr:DUF5819 family protein [uncultured Streptomyces sp.]